MEENGSLNMITKLHEIFNYNSSEYSGHKSIYRYTGIAEVYEYTIK